MQAAEEYEITFETDDPALVEALIDPDPDRPGAGPDIPPGIVATPRDIRQSSGIIGTEIIATIAFKVIEGVATKILVDLILKLGKTYGARLKINGKPVAVEGAAIEAELAAGRGA